MPLGRWAKVVLEAVLKVAIFLTYMAAISRMKEIHRVFEYHGAEHKTIACYEAGDPLTVENVRKYTRFHPRCLVKQRGSSVSSSSPSMAQ